jgi:hypothetical protein
LSEIQARIKEREKREQEILAKDPNKRTKEERKTVVIIKERKEKKNFEKKSMKKD